MKLGFRKFLKDGQEVGQFYIYFGDLSINGYDGWMFNISDPKAPVDEVLPALVAQFNKPSGKRPRKR